MMSRLHDRIVNKYRFPTDELLIPLETTCCEIYKICSEVKLKNAFGAHGCRSEKEPDIIYQLDDHYLIGEIKGRNTFNNYLKAKRQAITYSRILNRCDITNKPFVALGDASPRLVYEPL